MNSRGSRIRRVIFAMLLMLTGVPHLMAARPSVKQPHVTATLLADRTAVAAGASFQLAVRFEIDDHWHIYWATPGEPDASAMATTFELKLPPGFVASRALFPPPKEFDPGIEGKVYLLEGQPVVLFDVIAPAKLDDAAVTLGIAAEWLVCEKSCVRGSADLELSLPVAKAADEPKPANEIVFRAAAKALPKRGADAKYVSLSGKTSASPVKAGMSFDAELTVEIEAGHHIQSAKPRDESLVAARVFIEPAEGLELGKPVYPAGKVRSIEGIGKASEYAGRIAIRIPIKATDDLKKSTMLHGVLTYQACTDKGVCYPPMNAAFEIPVAVEGGGAVPSDAAPLFGSVATPTAQEPPQVSANPQQEFPLAMTPPKLPWLERAQRWFAGFGLLGYFALAIVGGFALNFMPCVLPVISLKILSFVKQAQESRVRIALLGLTFAAGIITSYMVLAALAFAANRHWGSLFQIPEVSIGLAAIVTAFSLSLFGVFTLSPPQAVNELGEKVSGEGLGSAFGMGLLATLLGTACTAPFLSFVIAFAVKQPPAIGAAIFGMAGVGMALPYIVLTLNPSWLRFVPRAGPWMKTFEQVMGFVLLGTVIWVLYPLPAQITGKGLIWALVFMLAVSFAAWLYGRIEYGAPASKKVRYFFGIAVVIWAGWFLPFRQFNTIEDLQAEANAARMGVTEVADNWDVRIPWRPYKRAEALAKVAAGYTVFVDYTADWCASCKANEASSLNIDSTRKLMEELKVVPYRADYTNESEEIKADLKRLGRAGVPVYVVYAPFQPDQHVLLPELITPGLVADALKQAGPSRAGSLAKLP